MGTVQLIPHHLIMYFAAEQGRELHQSGQGEEEHDQSRADVEHDLLN